MIKTKVKIDKDSQDLISTFMGDIRKNPELCHAKYVALLGLMKAVFITIDSIKAALPFDECMNEEYKTYRMTYAKDLIPRAKVDEVKKLLEQSLGVNELEYESSGFGEEYQRFKRSESVLKLLESYSSMRGEDKLLKGNTPIFGSIITRTFKPLTFIPSLDLKIHRNIDTQVRQLYVDLERFYKEYVSPDIDIDRLRNIILEAVEHMRARVPRIDKTINYIKRKSELLTSVINDSFEDYLRSEQNPAIIMSKFLEEVQKDASKEGSMEIKRGILQIIKYFNQNVSTLGANPKIKSMINMVTKITDKLVEEEDDDSEEITIGLSELGSSSRDK
jgi:hypothetical protein